MRAKRRRRTVSPLRLSRKRPISRQNCGAESGARRIRRSNAAARISLRGWLPALVPVARRLFVCWQTARCRLALLRIVSPASALGRMQSAPERSPDRCLLALLQMQFASEQERTRTHFALWGLRLVCTGRCGLACRLGSPRRNRVRWPAAGRSPTGTWLTCTEPAQR